MSPVGDAAGGTRAGRATRSGHWWAARLLHSLCACWTLAGFIALPASPECLEQAVPAGVPRQREPAVPQTPERQLIDTAQEP